MTNRRQFVLRLLPLAGTFALQPGVVRAAEPPELSESDPLAKALGFVADANKVDQAKYPMHTKEQDCANCLHFKTPGAAHALCDIFSKSVPKGGWCSAWAKRV